jgi:hypothetical protein
MDAMAGTELESFCRFIVSIGVVAVNEFLKTFVVSILRGMYTFAGIFSNDLCGV